jgi:integrase
MPVYLDKTKGRWRFMFNRIVGGSRHRASRLLPQGWSRAEAEKYDRQETSRLYKLATGVESRTYLIDDAVALYIQHKIPTQRAGHKAALHLAALLPFYEGRPLSDLPSISREYLDKSGVSTGTVRNRLAYLKSACRYAWKHHNVGDSDPTARMSMPSANNDRHTYLRLTELQALLACFDDAEAQAIAKIAFYTGLRWIAELLPRQPSDIQKVGKELWLNVGLTKNGHPHMVPIHPAIQKEIKLLPFTRHWRNYYKSFERARKKAGLNHVRMHDLRHSLASEIISNGGTLSDVQAALHHESVQSSHRYAHLYPERVRSVMMRIGK